MAFGVHPVLVNKFELATTDELERAFIRTLCFVYPSSIKAYEVMQAIGMAVPSPRNWKPADFGKHHQKIIQFHNLRIRVSQLFASFGWQVERTGGLVNDAYRIAPMGHREAA